MVFEGYMPNKRKGKSSKGNNPFDGLFSDILTASGGAEIIASGALKELRETLETIPAERVRKLSVTVPQAVAVGRHYARCFAEDKKAMAKGIHRSVFDTKAHDNMARRAEALWEADVLLSKTKKYKSGAPKLAKQTREMKSRLKKTAVYLWSNEKKKMKVLSKMKRGNSYLNLADDIFKLYHLFIENMAEVKRRTDITEAEMARAHDLGARLLDAVGPSSDERLRKARDLRARAGEYLREGIENIRTAAGFRFQGDEKHLSRYPKLGEFRKGNKKKPLKRSAKAAINLKLVR